MVSLEPFQIPLRWVHTASDGLSNERLVFRKDLSLYGQEVGGQELLQCSDEILNCILVLCQKLGLEGREKPWVDCIRDPFVDWLYSQTVLLRCCSRCRIVLKKLVVLVINVSVGRRKRLWRFLFLVGCESFSASDAFTLLVPGFMLLSPLRKQFNVSSLL